MGLELNNISCSRLGTMLYLEIQKGKEAMKASYFQQNIGGTAACMKRTMRDNNGCDQLPSNYTLFYISLSSRVKTEEYNNSEEVYCCGAVKTIHRGFFLAALETLMKE